MHRFFLPTTQFHPGQPIDLSPIAHQLRSVLRLQVGDEIWLLDGRNNSYRTRIDGLDRRSATGTVLSCEAVTSEPHCFLTLYQCALKTDKFEWVLQKGTEIGVSRFVPVISSRTVVRPAEKILKKYDRWQAIIREAAEQSGRGRLPTLGEPLSWAAALTDSSGVRLLPWEETTAASGVNTLGATLDAQPDRAAISLLVGPEGGVSEQEAAEAIAAGWRTVSLGPRILRAETAALVASALVLHYQDRLG